MKKVILIFSWVLFTSPILLAQTEAFQGKLKKGDVPVAVIKAVAEDFPNSTVTGYSEIPITIIDNEVYVYTREDALEEVDTYVVTLKNDNGLFRATYDKRGQLLGTSQNLENVALPRVIQVSIGRHFPGWSLTSNKIVMTTVKEGKQKTRYKVKLKKGEEEHYVIFDANGNIIRGAKKAKKMRQFKVKKERKSGEDYNYDNEENKEEK